MLISKQFHELFKMFIAGKGFKSQRCENFVFHCPNYVFNDNHMQILKSVYIVLRRIIFNYFWLLYVKDTYNVFNHLRTVSSNCFYGLENIYFAMLNDLFYTCVGCTIYACSWLPITDWIQINKMKIKITIIWLFISIQVSFCTLIVKFLTYAETTTTGP